MKHTKSFLIASLLIFSALSVFSQKYKTAADTVKLNKEYISVSNAIAELTSKLTIAQNNLPGYQTKSGDANSDAQSSAVASSKQASRATNGNIDDVKSAKKKANKAYNNAQDARDADNKEKSQDKKIANLNSQLEKKQARLRELDDIKLAIINKSL
jgi:DNA-binding transcriptional regulator GbsR (MarR family)